jgi:hypothetical protein
MLETATPSERRISCRFQGGTVMIDLGTDDRPAKLYLTADQASRLVSDLHDDLRRWLFRVVEEPLDRDEIVVADVEIPTEDAWTLLDALENLLYDSSDDPEEEDVWEGPDEAERSAIGDSRMLVGRVNWMAEGF